MNSDPAAFLRLPHRPYAIAEELLNSGNVRAKLLELTSDKEFLFLLKESSPGFYKEITSELSKGTLPDKLLATLYSYVMRFSFRSTPLGLTSSVSPVDVTGDSILSSAEDVDEVRIIRKSDSPEIPDDLLVLNSNAVRIGDHLFFNRSGKGDFPVNLKYRIDEKTDQFLRLFLFPISRAALLRKTAGDDPQNVLSLRTMINFWTNEKVILNVSSEFFKEFVDPAQDIETLSLEEYRKKQDQTPTLIDTYEKLFTRKIPLNIGSQYHDLIVRATAAIDRCFADQHTQQLHRRALRRFTENFIARYGERMVPLNEVLNPVVGIGFGELAEAIDNEAVSKYLKEKLSSFVLDRTKNWDITTREIEELASLNVHRKPNRPEGVTAYGSLLEKNGEKFFYLKNTISGTSTLGISRYHSMGLLPDERFLDMLRPEIPEKSDVIFAEIFSHTQAPIRSVRRRKLFLKYVITFNSTTGLKDCTEIPFSRLYILCRNQRLLLYSPDLKKIVVPVLNHVQHFMYDHILPNRFLCALAKQDTPHLNGWYWGKFTGETYWPRVQWKNIILFPRSWNFQKSFFVENAHRMEFRRANGIPEKVLLVEEGKELLLNFAHRDLNEVHFSKFQGEEIILYENLWEEFHSPVVIGNKTYVNEIQVSFKPEVPPYVPENIRVPETMRALSLSDDFLSIHLHVVDPLRFDVLREFFTPGETFYIFYGMVRNLTELRIRILGQNLLSQGLEAAVKKLSRLKQEGVIQRYSFSDFETDDHLLSSSETGRILLDSHIAHSKLLLDYHTSTGAQETDLYWFNVSYASKVAVLCGITPQPNGRDLRNELARKTHKNLMKRLHSKPLPECEIPAPLQRRMASLKDEDKAVFLSRVIHLNNLRVSTQANFEMDKSIINLLWKIKSLSKS